MKKKFLFAVLIMLTAGSTFYASYVNDKPKEPVSEIVLANVEALSCIELPEVEIVCGALEGPCWYSYGDCYIDWFHHAADCSFCGYTSAYCSSPCTYF